MIYYRVLPQYDQKNKNKGILNGNIYVANELYTLKEVEKQDLNTAYLKKIEVPKNKVYWFFGVRFEKNGKMYCDK